MGISSRIHGSTAIIIDLILFGQSLPFTRSLVQTDPLWGSCFGDPEMGNYRVSSLKGIEAW